MKSKAVQIIIVLVFALLVSGAAVAGVKPAVKPGQNGASQEDADVPGQADADTPGQEDDDTSGLSDADGPEKMPADDALAMISPEAYRSAEDLDVGEGAFVSILMREDSSAYAKDFIKGAERACDEINELMGYGGKDRIRVTCSAPAKANSISGQSAILDEELALYPDVIAASIVDAKACEVQFDIAMDNGIYIVGFDSSPGYSHVAATVETDNRKAGRDAADRLYAAMKDKGSKGPVLIVANNTTSTNLRKRISAFKKRIKSKYPKVKIAGRCSLKNLDRMRDKIANYYAKDDDPRNDILPDEVTGEDMIRYFLDRHPKVRGFYMADEESALKVLTVLAARKARNNSDAEKGIGRRKPELSAVAFGSTGKLGPYLADGALDSYIEENAYGMGYATAIACLRIAAGKGNADRIETGYKVFPEQE